MPTDRPKKLLDQVREAIQRKHYSPRTAESYVHWIKRFIFFHHKRHPNELGEREIEAFLTHLAVGENVAISTQNQALSALLFLYRHVLKRDIVLAGNALRAKKSQRLPTVLPRDEVRRILSLMIGTHRLTCHHSNPGCHCRFYSRISPRRVARTTASVRLWASSLPNSALT